MSPKQDEISEIKQQQKELYELLLELKNSNSMNDKVFKTLEESNKNQQQIIQENSYLREKIEEIHISVYDPDRGIYKRINDSLNYHQRTTEIIEDLKKNNEELEEKFDGLNKEVNHKLESQEKVVEQVVTDTKAIKKIAGDDFEHISGLVWLQKHGKKIFWAALTSLITLLVTQIGPFITSLF